MGTALIKTTSTVVKELEIEIPLPYYVQVDSSIFRLQRDSFVVVQTMQNDKENIIIVTYREIPITTEQKAIDFSEFLDKQDALKQQFDELLAKAQEKFLVIE